MDGNIQAAVCGTSQLNPISLLIYPKFLSSNPTSKVANSCELIMGSIVLLLYLCMQTITGFKEGAGGSQLLSNQLIASLMKWLKRL